MEKFKRLSDLVSDCFLISNWFTVLESVSDGGVFRMCQQCTLVQVIKQYILIGNVPGTFRKEK